MALEPTTPACEAGSTVNKPNNRCEPAPSVTSFNGVGRQEGVPAGEFFVPFNEATRRPSDSWT